MRFTRTCECLIKRGVYHASQQASLGFIKEIYFVEPIKLIVVSYYLSLCNMPFPLSKILFLLSSKFSFTTQLLQNVLGKATLNPLTSGRCVLNESRNESICDIWASLYFFNR